CLPGCCWRDIRAPTARRAAAYELASRLNQRVWLGHFEVWSEDGEIVFRHALALPHGERPTLAQAASMIDAAIDAADRYFPAFDYLIRGGSGPGEAIDACLFETVGTA
ncbi:MAG: YbjN domain-containing protein, partial [Brevundimonas sp.]